MNLSSLLSYLGAADADGAPAPAQATRRHWLRQLGHAAVAGLPLAGLSVAPAAASTTDTGLDALTLLLKFEYLQVALYTQALAASGLVPAAQRPDVQRLQQQQQQHADFLAAALRNAGATAPAPAARYDFTGSRGGTRPARFPGVLVDFDAFLALAQQIEDAGVRTYLGQATNFAATASSASLLGTVLRLQAVESRHAAHLRTLRRQRGATVKSWPSNTDAALPAPVPVSDPASTAAPVGVYAGEANEVQLYSGLNRLPFAALFGLGSDNVVQTTALAEAFDEPLGSTESNRVLDLFS